jgi:hypothetical protein
MYDVARIFFQALDQVYIIGAGCALTDGPIAKLVFWLTECHCGFICIWVGYTTHNYPDFFLHGHHLLERVLRVKAGEDLIQLAVKPGHHLTDLFCFGLGHVLSF